MTRVNLKKIQYTVLMCFCFIFTYILSFITLVFPFGSSIIHILQYPKTDPYLTHYSIPNVLQLPTVPERPWPGPLISVSGTKNSAGASQGLEGST